MKKYVKAVLYAYPMLKNIEEEYSVHISNRALLSYKSQVSAEKLVEYLAKEIVCKQRLSWLRKLLDGLLDKLDDTERALLFLRYFSPKKSRKSAAKQKGNAAFERIATWADSTYFRRQTKVEEKVGNMLQNIGFCEEIYEKDFAFIDIFQCIEKFMERGGDTEVSK